MMIEYDRYQAGSPCQEWWVLMKRNGGYSWSGIYKKMALIAVLKRLTWANGVWNSDETLEHWKLLPKSHAKVFPDYIPTGIIRDYEEACEIVNASPKASATLSRRCLLGIIRDF